MEYLCGFGHQFNVKLSVDSLSDFEDCEAECRFFSFYEDYLA